MPILGYVNIYSISNCSYHWQAIHVIARWAQTRTRLAGVLVHGVRAMSEQPKGSRHYVLYIKVVVSCLGSINNNSLDGLHPTIWQQ